MKRNNSYGGRTLPDTVPITISDRTCVDCGGLPHNFIVADKVWDGLGLKLDDWICVPCLARRLNPDHPPKTHREICKEIARQRKRFDLDSRNYFLGHTDTGMPLNMCFRVPNLTREAWENSAQAHAGVPYHGDNCTTMTAEQQGESHNKWAQDFIDEVVPKHSGVTDALAFFMYGFKETGNDKVLTGKPVWCDLDRHAMNHLYTLKKYEDARFFGAVFIYPDRIEVEPKKGLGDFLSGAVQTLAEAEEFPNVPVKIAA